MRRLLCLAFLSVFCIFCVSLRYQMFHKRPKTGRQASDRSSFALIRKYKFLSLILYKRYSCWSKCLSCLPNETLDSWHSSVFWLLWLSYISYIYITISKLPHQLTTIYFYFNRTKASTRQYALSPSRLYFSDLMGKQIAFIC